MSKKQTVRPAQPKPGERGTGTQRRTRLSPQTRERMILDAAIDFFAEEGFRAETRGLAKRLGVSQSLIYRYFGSKENLIERVYEKTFLSRWNPAWEETLADRSRPLRERLEEYHELGARFTKWRAVISVDEKRPTAACIETNAHGLALYAALSQEAGLTPIVEPEVLIDGDHTIARCEEATEATLSAVFCALADRRVRLEGMLLKTGMVLSGKECPQQATAAEISAATLRCLRRTVPAAVPGIVFLSGGQSPEEATLRLAAICGTARRPWSLSFSYGRALQDPAMRAWKGAPNNVAAAQIANQRRRERGFKS